MNLDTALQKSRAAATEINEARAELLAELARHPDDEGLHGSLAQLEKELDSVSQKVARLEAALNIANQQADEADIEAARVARQETLAASIAAESKRVAAAQKACKALKPFASAFAEYLAASDEAFTAGKSALRYKAKSTSEFINRLEMLRQRDDVPLALMLQAAGLPLNGDWLVLRPHIGLQPDMQALEHAAQLRADKVESILGCDDLA